MWKYSIIICNIHPDYNYLTTTITRQIEGQNQSYFKENKRKDGFKKYYCVVHAILAPKDIFTFNSEISLSLDFQ